MKLPKAFIMLHNVVLNLTRRHSNLAFRGSQLSHQKQFQQMQQGIKISEMKRRHNAEDDLLRVKFGMDKTDVETPTEDTDINAEIKDQTQNQLAYYSAANSLQSKHSSEEQQLTQENKNKEVPMDMEIEQNNTQIQVVNADLESYQKSLDSALKGSGMD